MTGLVDRQRIKIPMIHKRIFCSGINISGAGAGSWCRALGWGHLGPCSTADSAPCLLGNCSPGYQVTWNQTLLTHPLGLLHDRFRQKQFIFQALWVDHHHHPSHRSLTVGPSLLVTISESPVCFAKIKQCVDFPFKQLHPRAKMHQSQTHRNVRLNSI